MAVFPALVDAIPGYLRQAAAPATLLSMPLGRGSLLSHLWQCLSPAEAGGLSVLAPFAPPPGYERALRAELAALERVLPAPRLSQLLEGCEPSDWLLVVDAALFPAGGFGLRRLLRASSDPRLATHLVAADSGPECAREGVLLDERGRVRRIQRYYAGVTLIDTCAVACSLISAAAGRALGDRPFVSLADLRRALAARGIPSRDLVLADGAIDLTRQAGLLLLSEQVVIELTAAARRPRPAGPGGRLRCGAGCRIDASARLYGPIVIQDGATIEGRATVIGPALLGAGCRVGRGSFLAQCVVAPGTRVAPGTTARQRILLERSAGADPAGGGTAMAAACVRPVRATGPAARGAQPGGRYRPVKCVAEALVALVALLVVSPLFLLVALLTKLTSRGPVFFTHLREGLHGRVFRCWKFRTMVPGAHARQRALYGQSVVDGPQFKLEHDPRLTRLGDWLRRTNIDELPQLINVLLGQMSLIGPRPSPFRENQICVPWRQARLSVRPGITGLWQLCRDERSTGDFHQWIHYDLLYVRHISPLLDFKIVLATLLTLGGRWSVPLRWLIPARKLEQDSTPVLPTRAPILTAAVA